ncbi:hypothetical protein PG996_007691 [Apiospora saccharicola]|uniref:Clr5 domain-containing protein n=1 Tax=Apiospora saccharicola TaxID=335842 RepID=A0ABR1VBJ5_9PEZI
MAFNWDLHFDEVRTLYIKDGKTQQHIQKLFKEKYGCTARLAGLRSIPIYPKMIETNQWRISKKQWTQQLCRWKLNKNLSEKVWKSTGPVPTHSASLSGESDILSLDLGPGFNILGTGMHEFDFIYREVACYMPDEAPNSHNERAYQIAHGQGINSLHAMLEVLTFLLSNNMLFEKLNRDPDTYDRCVIGMLELYLKIASSFNGISFSKDRTIQVVLDEALASIIRSGRLDLLKTLVASNPSVKTRLNRPMTRNLDFFGRAMPIEVALSNGDVRTADYLLSNGARIYESGINTIPDLRRDSWHRWRVHDTLETIDWILTRCTKIREYKLLHILSLLEDGQHSEAPAALILEKLWQIERYDIGRQYGKPVIFDPETPYEARRPLRAALAHRQAGAIKMLLRAGANVTEDDIMEAIRQDMFDLLQSHSGFDMEITAPILISIVQNECLGLLADIELGTLPWTEDQAEGETALGNAIVMRQTHLISSLRGNGCLQYDPFALVAAVLTVKSSNDRSMIEYMLGLRAMTALRNEHIDTCSYLELAAFFIAIRFYDIETLKMLKRFGLFERFQALIPKDKTFIGVDVWGSYDSYESHSYGGPSKFFFERSHCLNQAYYQSTHISLANVFSTTSAGVSNGVGSLLGLAVGIGANRLTCQFLLQNLPKPSVMDIVTSVQNYEHDPLLIHDMINLATDIKSWEPTDHSTILGEAIYVGLDCVASRLLEMGVNVNTRSRHISLRGHGNVLLSACKKGNLNMVQKLLEHGAEVNSPHPIGPTALQFAVHIGHVQLATLLLDHDADCNAGGWWDSAIEYAAEKGHIDMIELLLARGVQTKGIYRRQYFRAIKFASEQAHYVAESILRNHRPWDAEDQNAFEKTHI